MSFNLDEYFTRINYSGSTDGSSAIVLNETTLYDLHLAQAYAIPFENIDVLLGRSIQLDADSLFEKLVQRNRGGYCFELNGLFALALEAIGFSVQPLLARVAFGRPTPGPKTHQALLVTIGENSWLADVGFGGPGLRSPLPFLTNIEVEQAGANYRLRTDDTFGFALQRKSTDDWQDLYLFSKEPVLPIDFMMSNYYTSTSPDSRFRQGLVLSRPTERGRTTINDWMLAIHEGDSVMQQPLGPGSTLATALRDHFCISLDADLSELGFRN